MKEKDSLLDWPGSSMINRFVIEKDNDRFWAEALDSMGEKVIEESGIGQTPQQALADLLYLLKLDDKARALLLGKTP